jgi:thioredoxin-like negative regulator of GroEL
MDPDTNYYLVDVDKVGSSIVEYYDVKSIPQIFLMQKGKIIDTIESRTSEAILEELGK